MIFEALQSKFQKIPEFNLFISSLILQIWEPIFRSQFHWKNSRASRFVWCNKNTVAPVVNQTTSIMKAFSHNVLHSVLYHIKKEYYGIYSIYYNMFYFRKGIWIYGRWTVRKKQRLAAVREKSRSEWTKISFWSIFEKKWRNVESQETHICQRKKLKRKIS